MLQLGGSKRTISTSTIMASQEKYVEMKEIDGVSD